MARMKAVQATRPGADWELVEREIPRPKPGQVRVKVQACGVCHSDMFVKEGHWPGLQFPRIPGHEIAGVIDAVGSGVTTWNRGQRVGVGWHGGHCFTCDACRRGSFINCKNAKVTGISHDGGYADYAVVPEASLARIPENLSAIEAGPLMCGRRCRWRGRRRVRRIGRGARRSA